MKINFKIGLLGKIVIAIILGCLLGGIFPVWLTRLFQTFNSIFSQFLSFLIPLIIFGFVTPAIADIGKRAGKMLLVTVLLAYFASVLSGGISFAVCDSVFPRIISPQTMPNIDVAATIQPYFTIDMPPLFGVMSILVFSFIIGLVSAITEARSICRALFEFRDIVSFTINRCVIPLLPLYIFCIFLNMSAVGQVAAILSAFVRVIVVIFIIHIGVLLLQYCIAALFARKNPFKMLWTMMPAYFTALGTQSSAATIPVTLRQSIKMGVTEDVAGFVVPLCATIHMSGSMLKLVACALALMILQGIPYDTSMFVEFIALLAITIVAAPGIPGGAIMASLGLLSSILGFTDAQNAMMIALYIAMDSFGTACNVTGDGALATIIDFFFGTKKQNQI